MRPKALLFVVVVAACEREQPKPKPAPAPAAIVVPRTLGNGRPACGNVASRAITPCEPTR